MPGPGFGGEGVGRTNMFSGRSGRAAPDVPTRLLFAKQTRKRYSIFLFLNDINLGPLYICMCQEPSRDCSS